MNGARWGETHMTVSPLAVVSGKIEFCEECKSEIRERLTNAGVPIDEREIGALNPVHRIEYAVLQAAITFFGSRYILDQETGSCPACKFDDVIKHAVMKNLPQFVTVDAN